MGFQHMTPDARRQMARKGGAKRAAAFTSESQAAASRAQSVDLKRAAGAAGFKKLAALHGPDFAAERVAGWRRAHPNQFEIKVASWSSQLGIGYERETKVGTVWADFVLADLPAVVEVDGAIWHTNAALHGDDRAGRDAYKNQVYAGLGLTVIRLDTKQIDNGSAFDELAQALAALAQAPGQTQ